MIIRIKIEWCRANKLLNDLGLKEIGKNDKFIIIEKYKRQKKR